MGYNACYNCKERWVSDDDRCHAHCEKYINFRKDRDIEIETDRQYRDSARIDTKRYRDAMRNKKKRIKRRQK